MRHNHVVVIRAWIVMKCTQEKFRITVVNTEVDLRVAAQAVNKGIVNLQLIGTEFVIRLVANELINFTITGLKSK